MGRTCTKQMTVILEADPDEEGWFSLVSVNGKTEAQCWDEKRVEEVTEGVFDIESGEPGGVEILRLAEIRKVNKESTRLTDEQCLVELWHQVGTDAFWSHGDAPDMKGKPYIKMVGRLWWEEYNSVDYGVEYDDGFEIESEELLKSIS